MTKAIQQKVGGREKDLGVNMHKFKHIWKQSFKLFSINAISILELEYFSCRYCEISNDGCQTYHQNAKGDNQQRQGTHK